ncbi:ribosome biogenesis GTPase Der [Candidatus Phycosocius spiralis]|uniref:GTPase Der n=1 Tax=Candidatus Phycosocius spiralis TaxID=2815099 RepID=A0ABQ4PW83_9PROT|nr:ribosome biogenesis GTPase Der [Candidatus Phycosocius spiralis]GIU67240.1 GTPase Der [Candidatus Phycosocius spiralis]
MTEPIKIAVVGRPNVGKSTLFNRLAGRKLAIVDDTPGVTRDRREASGRLGDLDLILIDTAGFETAADESLEARMRLQTEAGIQESDLCLFLMDARAGVTPIDEVFADILRRSGKPVILAANKAEGQCGDTGILEAYALGLGEPIPISGEHGEGMSDLFSAIVTIMGDRAAGPSLDAFDGRAQKIKNTQINEFIEENSEHGECGILKPLSSELTVPLRIAVIGRPNAGKSTLVNALIGEERLLTGPEAGITRDSIGVDWVWDGRPVRLVDTAGMRRKTKIQERLESLSVADTLRAIRFAEICLLVMDAEEAFEKQDLQIADLVAREGRGLIYVLAKWDRIKDTQARLALLQERADKVLPQTRGAPLIPISSLSGRGLDQIMPLVIEVHEDWNARVKTRDLNDWLREVVTKQPPPAVEGRRVKPRYIAQIKARPPTFVLLASRAEQLPDTYVRYLVNGIRKAFDMPAVPIRFMVRAPKNPYAGVESGRPKVSHKTRGGVAQLEQSGGGAPKAGANSKSTKPNSARFTPKSRIARAGKRLGKNASRVNKKPR